MAKISQMISTEYGGSVPKTSPARTGGESEAVGAISALASAGLTLFDMQQKKEAARKQNETVASVHTSFLDLEDEAIMQRQEAQGIQNQISNFWEDGNLSGDEMKMMQGLQKDIKKLDLLTPAQRKLRKNALLRQALNDPDNANMAANISKMFGNVSIEPPEDPVQAKFNQGMDAKYGVGNWTLEDAGREQGKARYLTGMAEKATKDVGAVMREASLVASTLGEDTVLSIRKEMDTSGALSQDFINDTRLSIAQQKAEGRKLIMQTFAEHGSNLDTAVRDKAIEDFNAYYNAVEGIVAGDGNMADPLSINKQLENLNKLSAEAREFNTPSIMQYAIEGASSSGNSFSNMLSTIELLRNEKTAALLEDLNNTDRSVLLSQAAEMVKFMTEGDKNVDAVRNKFGNTRLLQVLGANVTLPNAESTAQVESALDAVVTPPNKDDPFSEQDANAENIVDVIIKNSSVINAKEGGEYVKLKALDLFTDSIQRNMATPDEIANLHVVDNQIVIPDMEQNGIQNKMLLPMRRDIRAFNALLRRFPEMDAAEFLQDAKNKAGIGPDARPSGMGAPTTPSMPEPTLNPNTGGDVLGELPPAGGETPIPEERPVVGGTAEVEASRARIEAIRDAAPAPFDTTAGSDLLGPTDGETSVPQAESTATSRAEARAAAGVQAFNEQNPQNPAQETSTVPKAVVTKRATPVSSDDGKKFGKAEKEVDTLVTNLRSGITDPDTGETLGLEGFSETTYVPDGPKSGITIGTGIDLRYQSEQGLIRQGVPKAVAAKLRPYYGKKDKALVGQQPLTRAEIETLDKAVVSYSLKQLKSAIPEFDSFPDALKLGLYKAKHQYGKFDSYSLKSQAVRNDIAAAITNLMTWKDSSKDVGGNIAKKYQIMGKIAARSGPSMILEILKEASEEYKRDFGSIGSELLR